MVLAIPLSTQVCLHALTKEAVLPKKVRNHQSLLRVSGWRGGLEETKLDLTMDLFICMLSLWQKKQSLQHNFLNLQHVL